MVRECTYRCKRSIMSKWASTYIGDAFDWWVEANPELYYLPRPPASAMPRRAMQTRLS